MKMNGYTERMEIHLTGGRPWGFFIKGGREHNKPLSISKLERGGKAESGGLFIGDILHSINDVPLSGIRDEALRLVKMAGHTLILEIERFVHTTSPNIICIYCIPIKHFYEST